ncbi:MAG: hypothetical protein HC892_00095 [Saprospiraceae bacterium]|nr:hypothetical protein [Saprospiraceae bacterium]
MPTSATWQSYSAVVEVDWKDTEPVKTAESQALKRAAGYLGIGRYLYDNRSPWAEFDGYRFKNEPVLRLPPDAMSASDLKALRESLGVSIEALTAALTFFQSTVKTDRYTLLAKFMVEVAPYLSGLDGTKAFNLLGSGNNNE